MSEGLRGKKEEERLKDFFKISNACCDGYDEAWNFGKIAHVEMMRLQSRAENATQMSIKTRALGAAIYNILASIMGGHRNQDGVFLREIQAAMLEWKNHRSKHPFDERELNERIKKERAGERELVFNSLRQGCHESGTELGLKFVSVLDRMEGNIAAAEK